MVNILKSLFDSVGGLDLFKKRDDSIVGIDIGSSSVKAIQFRRERGRRCLRRMVNSV